MAYCSTFSMTLQHTFWHSYKQSMYEIPKLFFTQNILHKYNWRIFAQSCWRFLALLPHMHTYRCHDNGICGILYINELQTIYATKNIKRINSKNNAICICMYINGCHKPQQHPANGANVA